MTVIGELVARARHAAALAGDPLAAGITARLLLDAVGCAVGGLGHPLSPALAAMLGPELGRTPRSRVLAEATLLHADEFDAIHTASAVLPCATVVPAALEAARHRRVPGRLLLAGIMAGGEVALEAGLRFGGPALYRKGWWPTALFGPLGAAAATSVLAGQDDRTMEHALALAASRLGGLLSADQLGAGHYLLVGRAAADGRDAALAAGAGMSASTTLLDGPAAAALGGHAAPATTGDELLITSSAFKAFPCARPLHAVVEAVRALRDGGTDVAGSGTLRIGLPSAVLRFVTNERNPAGPAEAAASAPYVIAATLDGCVDQPDAFRFVRPIGPAPRVDVYASAEMDRVFPEKWGAVVEVVAGGSRARARVDEASGGAGRPWAADQVVAKFERLAGKRWPPSSRPGWVAAALELPTLPDASTWIAGRPSLGAR